MSENRSRPRAGQAGNHADQTARRENAPYGNGKTIYCDWIKFVSLILLTMYDSVAWKAPIQSVRLRWPLAFFGAAGFEELFENLIGLKSHNLLLVGHKSRDRRNSQGTRTRPVRIDGSLEGSQFKD